MDKSTKKKHSQIIDEILNNKKHDYLEKELNQIHPAELADILESLPEEKRLQTWRIIDAKLKGEILLEAHGEVEAQLIKVTKKNELISALKDLQLDELIDLEKKVPSRVIDAVIKSMDEKKQQHFREMKKYPANTAGGLMDVDTISIHSDESIENVLKHLRDYRNVHTNLPEYLNSISVVDSNNIYQGELSISDIVSLPKSKLVSEVMDVNFEPIPTNMKQNKVAKTFEDKDLISTPVVDQNNHLVGRITIDDVVDVIRSESERMMLGPVGLSEKTDLFSSIVSGVKKRFFWLGINLIIAFLAAMVISFFSASIEKIVALAILMPVVASMSGVVGNQTVTLVTRGIALSQITSANRKLLVAKEATIGVINGLIWASVVGVISYIWFDQLKVSLIFALAMFLSIFFAAVSGTVIPIILNKLNFDPAIAGTVMIVAISDILGFFLFLSIASALLF